ncbi:MAG TPA: c-type cytochrome domain-containing protein [Chitinophagaceae bacterium]|nr:c-type cytochrome domain-containing protein [Chitinophagaceae bacterium]
MIILSFLQSVSDFIGHLHPALVHLPIGILLLAGVFQLLAFKPKFASLQAAMSMALFWGMITAIASAISGYILSQSGDYDEELVDTHKWFGISTAFVSLIAYLFNRWENVFAKWVILLMIPLIIITGHLGGTLTHGSNYLIEGLSNKEAEGEKEIKPIADVQEANVYAEIIQPIFERKCYTCHNKSKKKGGLRLDEASFILKGGKDGEVIKPGNAEESDMIKRLLLPRNDEDHMPPKEKPQLKENEIELIHWWIATGASFDKRTKELEQPEKIKPVLLALQKEEKKIVPDIPSAPVERADEKAIQKLKERGIVVLPVAQNSNYVKANFVVVDSVTGNDIRLLLPIKKQLVWLKLSGENIHDSLLTTISHLTNLTRLQLDNTPITDKGLISLQPLLNLQYLNLVGTNITAQGLTALKNLQRLQALYIYKTFIVSSDWPALRSNFSKVTLDTGGYVVPTFETDTTMVKPPEKKNN